MLAGCGAALAAAAWAAALHPRRTEARPENERPGRGELWTVLGLIFAGLLIRAPRIHESLWYDEVAAWREFGAHGPGAIVGNFYDPANHMAHTLLTWVSVSLTSREGGASWGLAIEPALRLPALLFSLGSIAAVYAMARARLEGRVAVLAAGAMAIAPVSVLEGVEARGYSMMMCFAALMTWAWVRMEDDRRPWWPLVYGALAGLGAWSHLTTVFVAAGHALVGAVQWVAGGRRGVIAGAMALALGAVLSMTLYSAALPDLSDARRSLVTVRGDEPRVLGIEGWHAVLQLGGSWAWWAAAPGLALAAAGLARAAHDPRARGMAGAALAGLPAMMAALLLAGSWMYARFALFTLPGTAVLVALGLEGLWRRRRAWAIVAAAILVAGWAADLLTRPPKQPLRDAVDDVRASCGEASRGLIVELRHQALDPYLAGMSVEYSLGHGADLEAKLAASRPEWVILTYPRSVPGARRAALEQEYELRRTLRGWADWGNGDVLVYERKRAGGEPGR
jgi:hypothetical protein